MSALCKWGWDLPWSLKDDWRKRMLWWNGKFSLYQLCMHVYGGEDDYSGLLLFSSGVFSVDCPLLGTRSRELLEKVVGCLFTQCLLTSKLLAILWELTRPQERVRITGSVVVRFVRFQWIFSRAQTQVRRYFLRWWKSYFPSFFSSTSFKQAACLLDSFACHRGKHYFFSQKDELGLLPSVSSLYCCYNLPVLEFISDYDYN